VKREFPLNPTLLKQEDSDYIYHQRTSPPLTKIRLLLLMIITFMLIQNREFI